MDRDIREINSNSLQIFSVHFAASLFLLCLSFPLYAFPPLGYLFFVLPTLCWCRLMLPWAFIVVAWGRTWHGDKGMLLSSAAFKLPGVFWQFSPLHFSRNMATILGAYIPLSWRKQTEELQFQKMLKHFWVLWGQKLWDNIDFFMLTLFPEDIKVMPKQPQEIRKFLFLLFCWCFTWLWFCKTREGRCKQLKEVEGCWGSLSIPKHWDL